jgi:HEAT repeat protein
MIDQINNNNDKTEEMERVLSLAQSRNPRDRSYAAKRLGELKERQDILISLLDDLNGFVRSAAAEALGRSVELPAPEVISHLLAAIDDPNNYVCAAAVNSLGLLEAKQAVSQVEVCLEDTHPIVVQAAILALARIDPSRLKDRLVEYLRSEEYLIHLAATRVCGWLMRVECGPFILNRLREFMGKDHQQDLKLPKLYIEVLARLNIREAIPDLVEIANKEVGLRGVAVEALVEMNAEEAAAVLSPLLSDPSNRLRRNLIEMMIKADYEPALPLIRPLLKDNAITVRETALAAVSKWGDKVSVDDVRQIALNDPNPFVRPQAVITLARLMGQEALQDLVDLSEDLNVHVRRAVAQSLAAMDSLNSEGKAALIRLAHDEDTADFAQDALATHDLTAIQSSIAADLKQVPPVPKEIRAEARFLLNQLETWQAALPELHRKFDLEELADIDQALSTLILYLRKADRGNTENL